jgi:hypothetical protein
VSPIGDTDPIPLSHLGLDLPVPTIGWLTYLGNIGVEVLSDDVGRPAISRTDARRLIAEHHDNEVRKAEKRAAAEKRAIEDDQRFRAQFWSGVPADRLPPDVHPAAVMLQASREAQPKRMSPLQEALSGESLTFHSFAPTPEDGE